MARTGSIVYMNLANQLRFHEYWMQSVGYFLQKEVSSKTYEKRGINEINEVIDISNKTNT